MSQEQHVQAFDAHRLELALSQDKILFVDFWASWCAPCQQFSTLYARMAKEYAAHKNLIFASINVEEETELSETFNIRSIPHLMVFKDGIAIYSDSGSMPESALRELVEQALAADVTAIKEALDHKDTEI